MKNWKRLLLCIVISIVFTTFIGTSVIIVRNFILSHEISQKMEDGSLENNIIENANYREIEKENNIIKSDDEGEFYWIPPTEYNGDSTEEEQEKTSVINSYSKDTVVYVTRDWIVNIMNMFFGTVVVIYETSIITGTLIGILAYVVLFKKKNKGKIVTVLIICLAIVSILIYFLNGYFGDEEKDKATIICFYTVYIGIFSIVFLINYIKQKRTAKLLNEELNK